jgi:hypothetical protein
MIAKRTANMFNLDQSITEWRQQMVAGGIKSPRVLDELESHLREEMERKVRSGSSAPEAFGVAVERMGRAAALNSEFEKVGGTKEGRRRKYLWRGSALGGTGLFVAGISFCYFVIVPLIISANEQYVAWSGIDAHQWRGAPYVSFVWKLMFGFGAACALPACLLTLINIGVLDYRRLVSSRRYVIVFNLILGAVLTTPEVVTQLLMFIPLQLIYEVSVWLAWYSQRKEMKCI